MQWIAHAIDYGVIGLLLVLSFIVVTLAVERFLFYKNTDVGSYSSKKKLELQLTKNLAIIGIVASNAPYIGLLGTVLGIMLTFYNIGLTANMDTGAIMVSLALALKATAAGLIVAIVAVVLYNLLGRTSRTILIQWDIHNER